MKYEITFPGDFVVCAVPVNSAPRIELYSLHGLLRTLRHDKSAGSWFAFVKHSGDLSTVLGAEGKPTEPSDSRSDAAIDPDYIALCDEYADIFKSDFGLPPKRDIELTIDLIDPD